MLDGIVHRLAHDPQKVVVRNAGRRRRVAFHFEMQRDRGKLLDVAQLEGERLFECALDVHWVAEIPEKVTGLGLQAREQLPLLL